MEGTDQVKAAVDSMREVMGEGGKAIQAEFQKFMDEHGADNTFQPSHTGGMYVWPPTYPYRGTCPNCGYCPCCGRSARPYGPYWSTT